MKEFKQQYELPNRPVILQNAVSTPGMGHIGSPSESAFTVQRKAMFISLCCISVKSISVHDLTISIKSIVCTT